MTRRSFLLLTVLGLAIGFAGLIALPHDRYHRFQAHELEGTRKADWIYERLHFDPTPVDVALIGTSRIAGGLSGPQIERAFCDRTGRRVHVANLAIPEAGRNMDYLLVKELLRTKAPALIVLQLTESESRLPHPGFLTLADARDILTAPLLINLDWPDTITALPGRQLSMAIATWRGRPAVRESFDPAAYRGPHMDRTVAIERSDGSLVRRDIRRSREDMERASARRLRWRSPTYFLPGPLRPLEYRFSRVYLGRVEAMAAAAGADLLYAAMPGYGFPPGLPDHIAALAGDHPVVPLTADLVDDHRFWVDVNHVNTDGARRISARLAEHLARTRPDLGRPAGAGCPPGPQLRP